MKDIYDLIEFEITKLDMKKKRGENVSTVEYNDYVQLRGLMKDIAVGGDSFIWNGETTIHSDSKVVALDTSGFAEGNEKLKKIQYFNVLTWVWEQASQNREERCIIVADEAYMMIDQRVPTALIHMRNMAKRGRKYNVSIMTISHSVVDFLAPAIKQYGQELIGTSCYKMFFGCEGQNLLELSNLYDLKEAERDFLLGAEQGYALAQFGSKRVIVHFKVGDYKKMKQGVMEEVKQIFRPEFLNRIDEMIVFHTLDKENMKKIVSLLCNEFTGRLEKQMNIHLKLRNSAKELIVEKGTDTKYGARPLRRALQTELEDKLADAILNGDIRPGDHVEAGASKKEIRFFIKSS